MRRGFHVVAAAVLAVLAVSPATEAAQPRWSAQVLAGPSDSQTGGVGIDGSGGVTVLTHEGSRMVGRFRAPGHKAFSGPVDLGPTALDYRDVATSRSAQLGVAESGEVALLYADNVCQNWSPRSCTGRLYVRTGPTIAQLSPPELLTENGHKPTLDVAPDGHMAVAWQTAPDDGAALEVALRPPRGTFSGARQRIGTETQEPASGLNAAGPSVAINTRGQAVAVWQQSTPTGPQARATYREANSSFGPPEFIANSGYNNEDVRATAAIDAQGGALVGVVGATPGLAWRPPGGNFRPPVPFGPSWGHTLTLISHQDTQVAAWSDWSEGGKVNVMSRTVGAGFGPARTLRLSSAIFVQFAADSRGNLHMMWRGGFDGPTRAATLDRLDLTPSEITGSLTPREPLASLPMMASNSDGQVAGIIGVGKQTPDRGLDRAGVTLIERLPDAAPPRVALRTAAKRRGLVRTRVRCSESCVATATVTATYRHKRKTRRPAQRRSRAATVRRGSQRLFAVRLTGKERRRLRKLVRQRRAPKASLAVSVEDSGGNRATSRRRISLKRLLR